MNGQTWFIIGSLRVPNILIFGKIASFDDNFHALAVLPEADGKSGFSARKEDPATLFIFNLRTPKTGSVLPLSTSLLYIIFPPEEPCDCGFFGPRVRVCKVNF